MTELSSSPTTLLRSYSPAVVNVIAICVQWRMRSFEGGESHQVRLLDIACHSYNYKSVYDK